MATGSTGECSCIARRRLPSKAEQGLGDADRLREELGAHALLVHEIQRNRKGRVMEETHDRDQRQAGNDVARSFKGFQQLRPVRLGRIQCGSSVGPGYAGHRQADLGHGVDVGALHRDGHDRVGQHGDNVIRGAAWSHDDHRRGNRHEVGASVVMPGSPHRCIGPTGAIHQGQGPFRKWRGEAQETSAFSRWPTAHCTPQSLPALTAMHASRRSCHQTSLWKPGTERHAKGIPTSCNSKRSMRWLAVDCRTRRLPTPRVRQATRAAFQRSSAAATCWETLTEMG